MAKTARTNNNSAISGEANYMRLLQSVLKKHVTQVHWRIFPRKEMIEERYICPKITASPFFVNKYR